MIKFYKYLAETVVVGGLLAGASVEANGTTPRVTQTQCMQKTVKSEKIACYQRLLAQAKKNSAVAARRADMAESEARQLDIEIEALRKVRALQKKRRTP